MPPNPKRPSPSEFVLSEDHILDADDPRPQHVPQYPSSTATRRSLKNPEEAIPTSIFDTEADQELKAQYGGSGETQYKPAFIYVERGPGMGQLLEVRQGSLVIGRASVADLRLQHPSVSRRHCQVRRAGEDFYVKDLGSQNGTFVNKQRIATEVKVKPGDSIALGNALCRLRGPLAKGEKLPHTLEKEKELKEKQAAKAARVPTDVVARPTGPVGLRGGSNALKVAIFAGALGFGMAAALAFGLVKALSRGEPTPIPVAQAAKPPAATPSELSPAEREHIIQEAIARRMAEQQVKAPPAPAPEAPVADPTPVEASPTVVVKSQPTASPPVIKAAPLAATPTPVRVAAAHPVRAQAAHAAADAAFDDEADAPAAKGGANRTKLLAAYEKGNAEGSLEAAKKAGDKALVGQLMQFLTAYDAANDAMAANNGTQAIVNFQKALALDEQLSSGWGKYGHEIRKNLSSLYVLVGNQYASTGEADKAKKAWEAAVKHDPTNAKAKAALQSVSGGGAAAGDDEAAPVRKPAKKAPPKSIDDAFGE